MLRSVILFGVLLTSVHVQGQPTDLQEVALRSVKDYVIHPAASDETEFKLVTEPVVRFNIESIAEGDILIWTRNGRPEVAAQVFQHESGGNKIWLHEFQSLSSEPIVLKRGGQTLWSPDEKGMAWTTLPADFAPAESPVARLRQMKQLARRFTGNEQTPGTVGDVNNLKSFEMRMKPREIFRYASPENGTTDGVMFYFGQEDRADPELLLLIEAETANGKSGWRYACAPLTCWPMQVMLDGKEVVSAPNRFLKSAVNEPYHVWRWE